MSHRKKGLGPDPWSVDLTGEPGLCRCSEGRMKADWVRVGPWPRDWGPYERKAGGVGFGDTGSQAEDGRVKMEPSVGAMQPPAPGLRGCRPPAGGGRGQEASPESSAGAGPCV